MMELFLTRNEWNTALEKKDAYFIHIWIKDEINPNFLDFKKLYSKNSLSMMRKVQNGQI